MTRKIFTVAGVALAALAVSACGGASFLAGGQNTSASVLGNLQGCDREYSGALGVGVSGSFRIVCKAQYPTPAEMKALADGEPVT